MTEDEIQSFLQQANWQLRTQMEDCRKSYALDSMTRFDWHPWRGELVFSSPAGPQVAAKVQAAGTHNPKTQVWSWAWSLPTLPGAVRREALKVRDYGAAQAILRLMQAKWSATEADAWAMTAVMAQLAGAKGAHRCPGPEGFTYLVLMEIGSAQGRRRPFGARSCVHVLEAGEPILLVSRERDGEVLAVCGGEGDGPEALRELPLDRLLGLDPMLGDLADLPDGWVALRESPGDDWTRAPSE